MSIVTKQGDDGNTWLGAGKRLPKSSDVIHLLGEIDELSARTGLLQSKLMALNLLPSESEFLLIIQSSLHKLAATFHDDSLPFSPAHNQKLEQKLFALEDQTEPLQSFILPGGSEPAALAHLARTGTRSCERTLALFPEHKNELVFCNRLSDYFFLLARHINKSFNVEENRVDKFH